MIRLTLFLTAGILGLSALIRARDDARAHAPVTVVVLPLSDTPNARPR